MTIDIDELERKAAAATSGRWQWFGNTKMHEVYLATVDRGRIFVMDFVRWGMRGAQPRFNCPAFGERDQNLGWGTMKTLGDLGSEEHPLGPRFEAAHRRQFSGIGHPDAEHIAANSPAVTRALIARIRELEAVCAAGALALDNVRRRPRTDQDDIDLDDTVTALCTAATKGIP